MTPMVVQTISCGHKRCRVDGTATAECPHCRKRYFKCEVHGGAEGAKRSLRSHVGLHHPKGER
jgi:hypothetical protein